MAVIRVFFALIACLWLTAPLTAQDAKPVPAVQVIESPRGSGTRIYAVPIDKVFLASAQSVAEKWHLTHSDKDIYSISFSSSRSMRSRTGSDVTVVCMEEPDGRTKVLARSQKPQNTKGQLFDWNAGGKVVDQFFELLETRLRELHLLPPK